MPRSFFYRFLQLEKYAIKRAIVVINQNFPSLYKDWQDEKRIYYSSISEKH